jgi:cell division septal protein FtsQ
MRRILSYRKYAKRSALTALAVLAGVCAVAGLRFADGVFRVKYIRVEGVRAGYPLYGLEALKNRRMLFLAEPSAQAVVQSANPHLGSVSAKKVFPDTLEFKVVPAKPVLLFKAQDGYFVLDEAGKIIAKTKSKDGYPALPVLNYFQRIHYANMQPGSELRMSDLLMAIRFLGKVRGMGMKVITIDIDGVDVIGLNLNKQAIIFSSEKDVESQVYQLEQILRQFRVQGRDFIKLDLRFNRPVLELVD